MSHGTHGRSDGELQSVAERFLRAGEAGTDETATSYRRARRLMTLATT